MTRIVAGANPQYFGLIVNGLALDEYRRRGRELLVDPQEDIEALENLGVLVTSPTTTYEDVRFADELDTALRELDEVARQAFILTELRGLTEREAADVLDVSQPTVHRRAESARLILREEIAA